MKKKSFLYLLISILFGITLSGCVQKSMTIDNSDNDVKTIKIYNQKNIKIATLSKKEDINSFYSAINPQKRNFDKANLPKSTKISYKYVIHSKDDDDKTDKDTLTVYFNTKKATMSNIPLIGTAEFKLSQEEFKALNNPQKFIN